MVSQHVPLEEVLVGMKYDYNSRRRNIMASYKYRWI